MSDLVKVWEVRADARTYQALRVVSDERDPIAGICFDNVPKAEQWVPPRVEIDDTSKPRGHFLGLAPGAFACDALTLENLAWFIGDPEEEFLPLDLPGEELYAVHCLKCFDLLDQDRTERRPGKAPGQGPQIARYEFYYHRLEPIALFTIPETSGAQLLTATGFNDPPYEFKGAVRRRRLRGLVFHEIWRCLVD